MNKPWIIWSFSALIALLVFGAMGMITQHTLGLEKERARAEAKAELEERIRLALWRMDTAASGILAEENNRPAWHFRDVDLRRAVQPTPLNLDVPENVRLHFEVNQGVVSTPQVNSWSAPAPEPVWESRSGQVSQGAELSRQKGGDWMSLQHLLNSDGTFRGGQKKRNVLRPVAGNNLGVICAVAFQGGEVPKVEDQKDEALWDAKVAMAQEQRLATKNSLVRNAKGYQANYNAAEKVKRKEIVRKSSGNKRQSSYDQLARNIKEKKLEKPRVNAPVMKDVAAELVGGARDQKASPVQAGTKGADMPKDKRQGTQQTQVDQEDQISQVSDVASDKKTLDVDMTEGVHLSSLTPVWLGEDLILVREVSDGAKRRVQGVWLDAAAISISLIKDIADLLPDARLEPVRHGRKVLLGELPDPDADDPMVMAALPWRLLPGEVAVVEPAGWTPMRKTLAVAWIGALLAALAAVVLLRGVVKLSERRASFVSSVTHELRTPLTTFSLYSDMLAEGMVQDEAKQKSYLRTLRKESARLTHLVENVLAYSRVERGSARARVETVRVGELVDRMCERLRARAVDAGMQLHCEITPDVAEREIRVDTTAVEQIIFNLVDNASKYASGEGCGKVIELRAIAHPKVSKGVAFQVCDEGPGVDRSEHRKLFRAFHKSAQDAAHSKPGVGLGLALCRRLARALGGDLKIVERDKGACFELTVGKS
jgi:signal transduction histidine kinase